MPKFELAVFDLDGTLLDTIGDVAECFNEALRRNGFPVHRVDEYPGLVGGDLEAIVSRLLPEGLRDDECVDRVKESYRSIYSASEKPLTRPYEGIYELLEQLEPSSMHLAVNSNKSQRLSEECMRRFFPFFTGKIVGYDESRPSKPDPYGLNSILRYLGVAPESAIYIGDGMTDMLTARNGGVSFAYVTWGQGSDPALLEGCDYAIRHVSDLNQLLMGVE